MIGGLGARWGRFPTLFGAGVLLVAGIVLAVIYFAKPHATLRITTGPDGGMVRRLATAFIAGAGGISAHQVRAGGG